MEPQGSPKTWVGKHSSSLTDSVTIEIWGKIQQHLNSTILVFNCQFNSEKTLPEDKNVIVEVGELQPWFWVLNGPDISCRLKSKILSGIQIILGKNPDFHQISGFNPIKKNLNPDKLLDK